MSTKIILNDEDVETDEPQGLLVLDFLRRHRRLVGTKEGCKEGDCGACGVMIGSVEGGELSYVPVTSCLVPLGELDGKHLVTIEGLNLPGELSVLQDAVVEEGGSQCGYCTPGIIVSMTHCLMTRRSRVSVEDMKIALSGHLCRCTGYGSLKRAAARMADLWEPSDREADDDSLEHHLERLVAKKILPEYFVSIPSRLQALHASCESTPGEAETDASFVIAGGTDLYVQRGEEIPDAAVEVLGRRLDLTGIRRENGHLQVGGMVTFAQMAESPEFCELVPELDRFMHLIASLQIRNRATLAGNVVNASPIGDVTILLLALEASIHLRQGSQTREMPLHRLYRGYKDLDKSPREILSYFTVPVGEGDTRINFEKVSKRKCLDIASVNSALKLRLEGTRIVGASLAVGGVAAVPKFLPESSEFLVGREASTSTVRELLPIVQAEISPIGDVRGSAAFKRLLAQHLVVSHFVKMFPETVPLNSFTQPASSQ
jgi:xanthine dehydrogenase small subunit